MQVADFDYHLPEELIAQEPLEKRDHSRLLVLERRDKTIHHCRFPEIVDWLQPGDLMVFNDTRVIPARLWGRRQPGGGRIEVLLLKALSEDKWEALVRPGRKIHQGQRLCFGPEGQLEAITEERTLYGGRVLCFKQKGAVLRGLLTEVGEVPLPHYIKVPLRNKERYQTIYSREEGSVAAPTAGLHFTPELMEKIKAQGVKIGYLTLHVGLGTFRPVKTKLVEEHQMHEEFYEISDKTAEILKTAQEQGRRIIAVGTTTVRTLESTIIKHGKVIANSGFTDIFIYPGYEFKVVDGLLTNFHLPKSTLIMLVSALLGREHTMEAYRIAIQENYRFFSFGDAMLII